MDWDELWKTFIGNCKQIFNLAYVVDETEQQKKFKLRLKMISVRLLNFFFIAILLMFLYLTAAWLYEDYTAFWSALKDNIYKSIGGFIFVSLVLLVVISYTIKGLLWLFKWVTITDIFKLYIFIELAILFLNFSKADRIQKGPIVLQMVDKVFNTNFFKPKVDSVNIVPKGILIRNKRAVLPK